MHRYCAHEAWGEFDGFLVFNLVGLYKRAGVKFHVELIFPQEKLTPRMTHTARDNL